MTWTVPINPPTSKGPRARRRWAAGVLGMMAACGAQATPEIYGWIPDARDVPPWAFGGPTCSATLIAPRVLLSGYRCVGLGQEVEMKQLATGRTFRGAVVLHPSSGEPYTQKNLAPAVPVLFLLTDPVPSMPSDPTRKRRWQDIVALPAYRLEQKLLKDMPIKAASEDDPALGTRLSAYSGNVRTTDGGSDPTLAYRHVFYRQTLSTRENSELFRERPLVHRSMSRLRLEEPARFVEGLKPATGEDPDKFYQSRYDLHTLRRLSFGTDFAKDRDVDDLAIFTVGTGQDRKAGTFNANGNAYPAWTISPFVGGDWGAGLLAEHRKKGRDYLVGVVQGGDVHPRMSAHWPWVYRALMAHGMTDDARAIAKQLLGSRSDQCAKTKLGELCLRVPASGGEPEFFRRVGTSDASLPADGRDGEDWEYLGTQLPDRRTATQHVRLWDPADATVAPKVGAIYARFNGKSRLVEYFRRKTSERSQPMDVMPWDARDSADWAYLGTDVSSRPIDTALTSLPGSAP